MSDSIERISSVVERIKKDKKAMLIVLLAVCGMLLILLSGGEGNKTNTEATESIAYPCEEYEDKLRSLLSKIQGVGKVSVMITYESGEENVFASDKEESFRNGEQKIKNDYIIVDSDKGESGLKIKSVYPEIKGVAVVCSGASDPFVKEQIISVISALFDISTKSISVVSAEN